MECSSLLLLLSLICPIFILVFKSKILGKNSVPLPPGPRPFPIIGNILEMGENPHRSLTNLSKTFGPLMTLKLGSITTIVISSPEFAKEALQKHEQALSGRTIPDAARSHDHHKFSVGFLPTLDKWRSLRKVMAEELFTLRKFEESQNLRHEKVKELLGFVRERCKNREPIDIGRAAFITVLNVMSNTFFSFDLASYSPNVSIEFHDATEIIAKELGSTNLADYFPILQLLDPQGIRRRTNYCYGRLFQIFDGIIVERLQLKSSSMQVQETHDILDSLLRICQEESNSQLNIIDIKHLLMDLFTAGTDTTTESLVWGMAELLRNPHKLLKLKNELKAVEGNIQECDIHMLPYLQATIKEIFRLRPVVPFLVPHKAEYEVEIGGFKIPKNAQILVNIWAMGRDGRLWNNPDKFEPERFLYSEKDVKGRHFELIPFGAGRRICPGLPLAHRMLHLMLASLIHSFDWKLANGMKPSDLDMSECFGLALARLNLC